MDPARISPKPCSLLAMSIAALALCGCPSTPEPPLGDSVRIVSTDPPSDSVIEPGAVVKLVYAWDAAPLAEPGTRYSVVLQLDAREGRSVTRRLLDESDRVEGVDSGVVVVGSTSVAALTNPVCGRLVLTGTVQDSLVEMLARSPDHCWKAKP